LSLKSAKDFVNKSNLEGELAIKRNRGIFTDVDQKKNCINNIHVEKAFFKYPQPDVAKIKYGFELRYSGSRRSLEINSKEIVKEKAVITKDKIYRKIKLSRVTGVFPSFSLSHITNLVNFCYY